MEAQKFAGHDKWRRFLSEYVIVVLGVITALAAQQSVEWLHHYNSRRQLEEDLRAEIRLNDPYLRDDIKALFAEYDWAARTCQTIESAVQANASSSLKLERYPNESFVLPRQSVWQHARESGALALLPRDEAQAYTALYRIHDILADRVTKWLEMSAKEEGIRIRFGARQDITYLPASRMSPAELEQLSAVLGDEAATARYVLLMLGRMAAFQNVLEGGSYSQEEMLQAARDGRNPVRQLLQAETATPPEREKPD